MNAYPVSFHAEAQANSGIAGTWDGASAGHPLRCAIPPEFDGSGGGLSPEDLFAQALTNCFIATFKVYAEKSKVTFGRVNVRSELVVAPGEDKRPVMQSCVLKVEVTGCERPDRVRTLAEKAFASGFILNSVKTKLTLDLNVA